MPDDFLPVLTTVREDAVVESLGVKVFGKEQKWRTRILFRLPARSPLEVARLRNYVFNYGCNDWRNLGT